MSYVFDEKLTTPLCEIMGRNGSDKGHLNIHNSWHNYTTLYHHLFKDMTPKHLRVFELGLGTNNVNIPSNMGEHGKPGASLYGWTEYFTNAMLFGADIDKDVLFNTDRIKTFYCDQTNSSVIKSMWNETELQDGFDIIIDDGLHTHDANVCFFENSIHKLNTNGYYIIEDIRNSDVNKFKNTLVSWKQIYTDIEFTLVHIPSSVNTYDNTVLVALRR